MEAIRIFIFGFLACYGLWSLMWKFIFNPFLELVDKDWKDSNHKNTKSENKPNQI